ncbi:hypothetical protein GE09DRAFT_536613 [Coniochaeta sp. 2T2.1]|nr:hypothetical protein GE09DRAFT_536613 [Coniochaeta sp. 2T2.1]
MDTNMSPEEATALLQATTYHRKEFDRIAFRSSPREERSVQPYIVDPFPTTPTSPPSFLGRLPHELLREICLDLDIRSLFRLRQVNQLTRQVVFGLSEYQAITHHALDALRASLLTCMARYQTLSDIYDPLCDPSCAFCGLRELPVPAHSSTLLLFLPSFEFLPNC